MIEKHFIHGTRNLYKVDHVEGEWTMQQADRILTAMNHVAGNLPVD